MANLASHHQGHMAQSGQTFPPPGRLVAPAIMAASRGGRHRKQDHKTAGSTPKAIPPHPPLVSGGWYRSLDEVLGPGRYPVASPRDRSVRVAALLGVLLGPFGICYTSVPAGVIAVGAAAIALILFGPAALPVIWPLAIGAAVTSALLRHRWFRRL